MTYAEQLERETERTRVELADTLSELRGRMTPGQMIDQIFDRVGRGGGTFVSNLRQQALDNPMALALIGAGCAWLMFGSRARADAALDKGAEWTKGAGETLDETRDAAMTKAGEWSGAASNMAGDARRQVGAAADRAGRSAAEMGEALQGVAGSALNSARETAQSGYRTLSQGARSAAQGVAASARMARSQTARTGSALVEFGREQPLVLAGLGLAAGAALGALTPQSEAEEQALAETGAELRETVREQVEAVRETAKKAADAAANRVFDGRSKPPTDSSGETREGETTTAAEADEVAASSSQKMAQGG